MALSKGTSTSVLGVDAYESDVMVVISYALVASFALFWGYNQIIVPELQP